MTGRPGYRTMEMIGGSSASYLARTPCVPLFSTCLVRLETEGLLDYEGRAGHHFHCTVEPSPGHIRCREIRQKRTKKQTTSPSQKKTRKSKKRGLECQGSKDFLHIKSRELSSASILARSGCHSPTAPSNPPTPFLPGECSQAHHPAPSSTHRAR